MRFQAEWYQGALAFYAKPPAYARTFTRRRCTTSDGQRLETLCRCDAPDASRAGLPVWLQANETAPDFPIRKPGLADITEVRTITMDFEYPPEPRRAHALARDLVAALVGDGLAPAGQPIEDSGAGAHLCIPIPAIVTAEQGGGLLVNRAVERVVHQHIRPHFAALAAAHRLAGRVTLGSFDIARVISVPGTWRPPHAKPDDVARLAAGYLRRWLPPDEAQPPARRESARLGGLIVAAAAVLRAELCGTPEAAPEAQPALVGRTSGGRPGDEYNRIMSVQEVARLLVCHGWRVEQDRQPYRIVLTRPGKDAGTSATIRGGAGCVPIFYSFSTTCAPFQAGRGYAPFGVYLTLEHGGDAVAAARALAALGFGEQDGDERRPSGLRLRFGDGVAAAASLLGERGGRA